MFIITDLLHPTDIDECAEGLDTCEGQICYNQPGGYSCSKPPAPITRKPATTPLPASANEKCADGTRFVRNRGCVDIDECREVEDACSSNEECVNTPGSYVCSCKSGFRRENLTQACVDINECQMQVKDSRHIALIEFTCFYRVLVFEMSDRSK